MQRKCDQCESSAAVFIGSRLEFAWAFKLGFFCLECVEKMRAEYFAGTNIEGRDPATDRPLFEIMQEKQTNQRGNNESAV